MTRATFRDPVTGRGVAAAGRLAAYYYLRLFRSDIAIEEIA